VFKKQTWGPGFDVIAITFKVMGMGFMWLGCVLARVSCGPEVVCTRQIRVKSIVTVVSEVAARLIT
jgi:hypothetical protein